MSDIAQAIEAEKFRFLQTLRDLFPEVKLDEISLAAAQIEEVIACQLIKSFLSNILTIFPSSDITVVADGFRFRDALFHVTCREALESPDELILACLGKGRDLESIGTYQFRVMLDTGGKFSSVDYLLPRTLAHNNEVFLTQLTKKLFAVGYKWLSDAISRAISRSVSQINEELYQFVRVMAPDEQFLEGLLFSVLVTDKDSKEKKDIVLLDDFAVRMCLPPAMKAVRKLGRNAISIVTELLTEVVDYEESVFAHAGTVGSVFEVDLSQGNYYYTNTQFNLSLRAVWGNQVCCFPIFASDTLSLICFFKTESRSVMEPFLKAHQEYLGNVAKNNIDSIHASLKLLKSIKLPRDYSWGNWGEFLGGFAGRFVKSFNE